MQIIKFVLLYLFMALSVFSQQTMITNSEGTQTNSYSIVPPPSAYSQRILFNKPATASFNVTYEGIWTPEEKAAFNKAVDIWKHLIKTNRSINISVKWEGGLPNNTLGQATTMFYNNFSGAPVTNYQYPMALAKQKNSSISVTNPDIKIEFSQQSPWSFNTDGIPEEGKYDFITIAMHEIAHGLGIASSMQWNNGTGSFGYSNHPTNTSEKYPTIFDKFLKSGTELLVDIEDQNSLGTKLVGGKGIKPPRFLPVPHCGKTSEV